MSGLVQGDTVLVVGGRQGIGRVLARRLRDMGMDVIIASRLCVTADGEKGIRALTLDARDPAAVNRCISEHRPRHTVTTCADLRHEPLAQMTTDAIKRCFESKFWTQFHVAVAASRYAMPRGSATLFSGLASRLNFKGLGITGIVNAAIERLVLQLAQEGRLRVNCIAPGVVRAPDDASSHMQSKEFLERIKLALPLARMVSADDVAEIAIQIMQNEGINGATIIIDGGQRAISTARP
jgi:NAD(P)-dependent dehydrogenase (short-subunit alcohol dehydrogenase family)